MKTETLHLHQYIERESGDVLTETLYSDRVVNFVYSKIRENAPRVFRALTSRQVSGLLGFVNFDLVLGAHLSGNRRFLSNLGVDLSECVVPVENLNTARKIFERKIRYWDCRPISSDPAVVVSPSDSRVLVGALNDRSSLFIKDKFFEYQELLHPDKDRWLEAFAGGDFAVFRLTPDKYHYNHTPVTGIVKDFYSIDGDYHACNPSAVVQVASPYSKNKRVVTIIDTDIPSGTGIGLVAMIEVVALMIGDISQAYSDLEYRKPMNMRKGLILRKGQPKSLYKPGSSTNVLLFQSGRIRFDDDLISNMHHSWANSRFSLGFGRSLVETEVKVRASIARRIEG